MKNQQIGDQIRKISGIIERNSTLLKTDDAQALTDHLSQLEALVKSEKSVDFLGILIRVMDLVPCQDECDG